MSRQRDPAPDHQSPAEEGTAESRATHTGHPGSATDFTESAMPDAPRWLLRQRVTVPERAPGFFERPALAERAAPTAHPLTLFLAPAGFGKTTLLAECCRAAADRGIPSAWLSLDENDDPEALDTYLAFAFQRAGVNLSLTLPGAGSEFSVPYPRTARLLGAVDALGTPCLLALDEAERITDPGAVAFLNFLIRSAPPCLHLAIACRELPPGFDLADPVFERPAALVSTDDLRFSDEDAAAFFGNRLTRLQLREAVAASAGWPIALRFRRNASASGDSGAARATRRVIDGWIESRFWSAFAVDDQRFLLAVGQFDWFDEALLGDVLGEHGAMARLNQMRHLDGLLTAARDSVGEVVSLHPLLRDHCARCLHRDEPARHAAVHRRIARALARRDHTVAAMRHASEARDAALAANILLDAGALRMALRAGIDRLIGAVRQLPAGASSHEPRLALARGVVEAANGQWAQARLTLEEVPRTDPSDVTGQDLELSADRCIARALLAYFYESGPSQDAPQMLDDMRYLADAPEVEPLVRATMDYGLSVAFNMHALFERGHDRGHRVLRRTHGSSFLTALTHLQIGQAAMAQGQVADAVFWYRCGRTLAGQGCFREPRLTLAAGVLFSELELERNRQVEPGHARLPAGIHTGIALDSHLAAADVAAERTLAASGADAAIDMLNDAWESARRAELSALCRHLAAQRVALLATVGRVDEARRTWQAHGLPISDDACTDLVAQSWREAESVSCARIRLLAGDGDRSAAQRLCRALIRVSEDRGLRRTVMRTHALALSLEYEHDGRANARVHLAKFLALYAETDYAGPLVRERNTPGVLADFVDAEPEGAPRQAAMRLLAATRPRTVAPRLTARETDVLLRLETDRDDDIAADLGLSRSGVRYHVNNLFAKLGVNSRRAVIRRARELGMIPSRE